MKIFVFISLLCLPLVARAQYYNAAGDYFRTFNTPQATITYSLTLSETGTFTFNFYRLNKCDVCVEENQYGQGSWSQKEREVVFSTDPELDITNDFTLDFTASKARIIKKPPRDKTDRVIQEHIQFYRSDIPWITKLKLFKVN